MADSTSEYDTDGHNLVRDLCLGELSVPGKSYKKDKAEKPEPEGGKNV